MERQTKSQRNWSKDTVMGTCGMGVETQRPRERAGPVSRACPLWPRQSNCWPRSRKTNMTQVSWGVPQWPACERREGLHCGACADYPDPRPEGDGGGALAWASLCQAIVLSSRGPGKGKDCSKVTGTHPGKAWWWLLGLACLSALESGLFWKLSSQNTPLPLLPCSRASGC